MQPSLSSFVRAMPVALFTLMFMFTIQSAEAASALKITHSPAPFGIKGQPLTLRAKVAGGAGGVESVTLYYALFRDAAPFRVTMASSGMDMYVGTIEAGLLSGLASISYYIEAQDKDGAIEETPWYDVHFKDPEAKAPPPAARSAVPAPVRPTDSRGTKPAPATSQDDEGMSALTIGLIAGGAVALGAGAYFLTQSDSDSGGGGGGSTNGVGNKAGTYSGTVTICPDPAGGPQPCYTGSSSVIVGSDGQVVSTSLLPGTTLRGVLGGNRFTLSAPVNDSAQNLTGSIVFSGTIFDDSRIDGGVSGGFTRGGTNGSFTGVFNLTK